MLVSRIQRILLLVALSVLLSACATAPMSELLTKMEPNKGAVLIKMEGNWLATVSSMSWTDVKVRRLPDGETFTLQSQSPLYYRRHVFAGQLPPGKYQVTELSGLFIGIIPHLLTSTSATESAAQSDLGSFTVEAGKVTDLGILVAYMPIEKANRTMRMTRVSSRPELEATLRRYVPEQKNELLSKPTLGWDTPTAPNKALLEEAKRNVLATGRAYTAANGDYWAGAQLGQILRRQPVGKWTSFDTGYLMPVSAVHADGQTILAGMDDGVVLISRDYASWKDISVPFGGTIVAVGRMNSGEIVAIVHGKDAVKVYISPCCDRAQWQILREIPFEGHLFVSTARVLPDGILMLTQKTKAFGTDFDIYRYNAQSRKWDDGPGQNTVVRASADASLLCGNDRYSTDRGVSWTKVELPGGMMICRDSKTLYTQKLSAMGWSNSDFTLSRSRDSGKTWENIEGKLPDYAGVSSLDLFSIIGYIEPLQTPGHLLLRTNDGRIYTSPDDGNNWKLEHEASDAALPIIGR